MRSLPFVSAGSTLKPFLYALALEKGYDSASEIPDTFRSYRTPQGDYLPLNADRRSYGPVSVRSALGNSLNISAVKVARDVGLDDFCRLLEDLDLAKKGSCSSGTVRPGDCHRQCGSELVQACAGLRCPRA